MKEADYTGAFLVIGGHVLVPIFALVIISIMVRSIKRYGGDPYEEMPWAGLFMLSLLVGLVILPAWIFIGYLYGLELRSMYGSSGAIFINVSQGTSVLIILLTLIVIGVCKASADEKDKARFKDVE
jgi:hypothetical protein